MNKIDKNSIPGIIIGVFIIIFITIILCCTSCNTRYSDKYYEDSKVVKFDHFKDTCFGLDVTKVQKVIFMDDYALVKYDNLFMDCSFDNLYKIIEIKYTLSMITTDYYKDKVINEFKEEMSVCYDIQTGIYSIIEN